MRRRLAAVGLVATWIAALALWTTPSTQAGPSSGPMELAADAFAPVLVPGSFAPVTADDGDHGDAADAVVPVSRPGVLVDAGRAPLPTGRPDVRQPRAGLGVVVKPPPKPVTRHALRGKASWYCKAGVSICMAVHPDRAGVADMYAAAGPRLRRAICGSDTSDCWRGRRVYVNGVAVVLADWCQCYKGEAHEKVIDLYWDAWARVPNVEGGVTVRW
ncbi:MAG TPA: hypothetical protein VFY23_05045 [Candidatus Limnocylindrales bacterium]|nr:hypothetical protein [Candidatus Limnocylindrales bacterium]